MDTFLAPIESPRGLMMKMVYGMTRRQFGKVLTPLKVFAARLPLAFGIFYGKISKLDKKLELSPEMVMLVREHVAHLNVCLFCVDIGRSFTIKASMNQAKFDALEEYRTSPLQRWRACCAGLCDGADAGQAGRSGDVCAHGQILLGTRDLRDSVAGGKRTFLQHDKYWVEHPLGHAVRYCEEASAERSLDERRFSISRAAAATEVGLGMDADALNVEGQRVCERR